MSKLIGCSIETDNKISRALNTQALATIVLAFVFAPLITRFALVVTLPTTDTVGDTRTVAFALWITLTFALSAELGA